MKQSDKDKNNACDLQDRLQALIQCDFLDSEDEEFRAFVNNMPDTHWAKYDLSAVRLGWEAYKLLMAYQR